MVDCIAQLAIILGLVLILSLLWLVFSIIFTLVGVPERTGFIVLATVIIGSSIHHKVRALRK